jgi:hypothetical protein
LFATVGRVKSQSSGGGRSNLRVEITPERLPRALLFAGTDAILAPREAASTGLLGRRSVAAVAAAHPPPPLERVGIVAYGAATHGIDHGQTPEQ